MAFSKRRFVTAEAQGARPQRQPLVTSGSSSSLGGTEAKLGLHSANGNLVISQGQIDAADEQRRIPLAVVRLTVCSSRHWTSPAHHICVFLGKAQRAIVIQFITPQRRIIELTQDTRVATK
ncbi:hypothetical protein B5807_09111 [Epicoccum nigrum]|uniref:Uncharacterized protein n=1 Tax=Epicoccum nigrum TaxID=105696 RepID=A0A1Y2LN41_EPING|nr:hypothetical protein B5807_09111 [Epicoccum nigrum]